MNTYEGLILLKPILDMDNSDAALKNVERAIEKLTGKIHQRDKMGRKRLAYEITKYKDSFISSLVFELPPENIKELSRILKLNEDVLRFVFIRRAPKYTLEMAGRSRRPGRPGFGDRDRPAGNPRFNDGPRGDGPPRDRGGFDRGNDRGPRPEFRGERPEFRGDRPERAARD